MTVEAFLTRELEVRFIDARGLATEAKLNLGVTGYASEEQEQDIIDEALNIFQQHPEEVQAGMKRLNASLNAVKIPNQSLRYSKGMDVLPSSSNCSTASTTSSSANITVVDKESGPERKFKFWPTRRR